MFSQRGVLNLIHNVHDLQEATRRVNANRLNAVDAELLSTEEVKAFCPILNTSPRTRYPILGGTLQRRGGNARHDAVAWGYARAADARGVDIIQNCEVTGIDVEAGRVTGVQTTQGAIKAGKVGIVVAGHSSVLARWRAFACRSRATPCRPWSRSRSSRCCTASSCRTACTSTSASPTRASW